MSHELPLPETSRATLTHAMGDEHVPWIVMALAFILDVLTTLYRLGRRLAELSPVVLVPIPAFRLVGASISLKLVVLAVAAVAWCILPGRYRGTVPVGVVVSWGAAGLMNTQFILVTMFRWAAGTSRQA